MRRGRDDRDDDGGFAEWYHEVAPAVQRRVQARVANPSLAREATAEAFARAYERWGRVQRLDAPEAWVVTVALNLCRRSWRRAALERRALERLAELHPIDEADAELVPADREVLAAVADLPVRMRDAVTLRYWADLPEHEVAAHMEVAPGTASAMLSQARGRLRARLADGRNQP